jgi:hypothetical protein
MRPNVVSVDAESSPTSAETSTDGEMLSGLFLYVSINVLGLCCLQS